MKLSATYFPNDINEYAEVFHCRFFLNGSQSCRVQPALEEGTRISEAHQHPSTSRVTLRAVFVVIIHCLGAVSVARYCTNSTGRVCAHRQQYSQTCHAICVSTVPRTPLPIDTDVPGVSRRNFRKSDCIPESEQPIPPPIKRFHQFVFDLYCFSHMGSRLSGTLPDGRDTTKADMKV